VKGKERKGNVKMAKNTPKWFRSKVVSFSCNGLEEINEELVKRGMDANDVINITEDRSHDCWYEVFCKKRI